MVQALLVGSESFDVNQLRDALRARSLDWDIREVASGEEALDMMEMRDYDVVACEAGLPGIGGAELLSIVRFQTPSMTRVLLAEMGDAEALARGAVEAHRTVLAPIETESLIDVLHRTHGLAQILGDPCLQDMLSGIGNLPRPSAIVLALNELMDSPNASAMLVARTIEQDPIISAKLLSVVNSAFYGLAHQITRVTEAVAYLGMDVVRNLCVATELMNVLQTPSPVTQRIVDSLSEHSHAVACVARELLPDRRSASNAYVAALLADIGLFVHALHQPDKLLELQVQIMRSNLSVTEVEMEIFGMHHAHLGAALLRMWGLPEPIVEAVARHHDANLLGGSTMDLTHSVFIAEHVVSQRHQTIDEIGWSHDYELEADYLDRFDQVDELLSRLGMLVDPA